MEINGKGRGKREYSVGATGIIKGMEARLHDHRPHR